MNIRQKIGGFIVDDVFMSNEEFIASVIKMNDAIVEVVETNEEISDLYAKMEAHSVGLSLRVDVLEAELRRIWLDYSGNSHGESWFTETLAKNFPIAAELAQGQGGNE